MMGYLYLLYCLIATLYNIFMDVSKFYHGDYYLEELKTIEGKRFGDRGKHQFK